MLSNKLVITPIISINDFLKHFENIDIFDIQNGIVLDFDLDIDYKSPKLCPIIQLAKPEDANEITQIFKEVYEGTYPFKDMEDVEEVCKMIKNPNYKWILFKIKPNIIVGCFGAQFDFESKRGNLFGYAIKKKYQNNFDILKAFAGSVLYLWRNYKNTINIWTGEIRTYKVTPQFVTSLFGLKPIAFLPNKDIFFNRTESEFLHIAYNENTLFKYRSKEIPKITRQVLNCFSYSSNRYHLGLPKIENPMLNFDLEKINEIKKKLVNSFEKDKFRKEMITINLKNSNSCFKFLYNSPNHTIEKTTYKVDSLEELFVFILEVNEFIKKHNIRYFECFVSAYKPTHQKVFLDAGFIPRGYVPSWNYVKERDVFEDYIIFSYFKETIDKNLKLIPETKDLLKTLEFFKEEFILNP